MCLSIFKELREKNYKVVEAIGVSEKNTGDLVHKKVAEVEVRKTLTKINRLTWSFLTKKNDLQEKYKQLLNEQRNLTRQAMAKIAPDVDIPESSEVQKGKFVAQLIF